MSALTEATKYAHYQKASNVNPIRSSNDETQIRHDAIAVQKLRPEETIAAISLSTSSSSPLSTSTKSSTSSFHSVNLNETIRSVPLQGQFPQNSPAQRIISPAANRKHNYVITVLAVVALGVGTVGAIINSPYVIAAAAVFQLALIILAIRKNYSDHKNKMVL